MGKHNDILSLEEAEKRAWHATDQIMEKFENSDSSARDRLFSQSLSLLLKGNTVPAPAPSTVNTVSNEE
jgi:hypothetical protein